MRVAPVPLVPGSLALLARPRGVGLLGALALIGLAGCGTTAARSGGAPRPRVGGAPRSAEAEAAFGAEVAARRPLAGAGARCQGSLCSCRPVDARGETQEESPEARAEVGAEAQGDPEGAPAPGMKRFELRTGRGLDVIEITVEGRGTLAKQTELVDASCGYLDLPPGRHRLHLRAVARSTDEGMEPALFVSEYGSSTRSWYRTFQFRCGGEGPCSQGFMRQWLEEVRAVPRGLFDACGTTKVESVRWSGQRSVGTTLGELEVDLVLHVYEGAPRFPRGSMRCKERRAPAGAQGADDGGEAQR